MITFGGVLLRSIRGTSIVYEVSLRHIQLCTHSSVRQRVRARLKSHIRRRNADKPHHIKVDYQFAQNKEAPLCKWEMICKQIEQSD